MIMIRAIIHIFSSYMIFDQQLKITFRKSSAPPPPILKKSSLPFLPTLKIFQPPSSPAEKGENTMVNLSSLNDFCK